MSFSTNIKNQRQREKFSHTLLKDNNLVKATEGMNSVNSLVKDEKFGIYDKDGNLTNKGQELLNDYHKKLDGYIDSKYSGSEARDMKDAVRKDIGLNSGHFSSRMNYIYTPSDCYKYNPQTKCDEITVYKVDHGKDSLNDLQDKQLKKMYEDLGLTNEEVDAAIQNNGFEDKERGLVVHVETKTADQIKAEEAAIYQENNDLKDVNESIDLGRATYNEMNETIQETFKDKAPQDISYRDYDTLCSACSANVACSKEEWEKTDPDKKAAMITDAFKEGMLSNMDDLLK